MDAPLVSVIETPMYLRDAGKLMTQNERDELAFYLACSPEAGDVIPETGGVRKVRWGVKGKGKRGGARVVYYFHDLLNPLVLLAAYAKNEKSDLTPAEKKEMRQAAETIKKSYRRSQ